MRLAASAVLLIMAIAAFIKAARKTAGPAEGLTGSTGSVPESIENQRLSYGFLGFLLAAAACFVIIYQ